eukprot:scaffold11742_cov32-Cyclotella_meneghiniana.AAC.1
MAMGRGFWVWGKTAKAQCLSHYLLSASEVEVLARSSQAKAEELLQDSAQQRAQNLYEAFIGDGQHPVAGQTAHHQQLHRESAVNCLQCTTDRQVLIVVQVSSGVSLVLSKLLLPPQSPKMALEMTTLMYWTRWNVKRERI